MGLSLRAAGLILAGVTFAGSGHDFAQAADVQSVARSRAPIAPEALKQASTVHLAYIKTTSPYANEISQKGLEALSATLAERTAVVPGGISSVDVETDDISLFPVLYWPVTPDAAPLSDSAQQKVQRYIQGGGFIIFDILRPAGHTRAVETLLGRVRLRPLEPMRAEHTLTRTFYLGAGLPGSIPSPGVWVESPGGKDTRAVTSVVIGEGNWAAAWAGRTQPAASRARELAVRSGVNMIMFALTGDYKDDKVHLPSLTEKLRR